MVELRQYWRDQEKTKEKRKVFTDDIFCRKCGKKIQELESGQNLTRVNEFGKPGIWECRPKICKKNSRSKRE